MPRLKTRNLRQVSVSRVTLAFTIGLIAFSTVGGAALASENKEDKKKAEAAAAHYQKGKGLAEERNFGEARVELEAALALDLEMDKTKTAVDDYVALAMLAYFQKQYDSADGLYGKALDLARAKDLGSVARIVNSRGNNAMAAGKMEAAKALFEEAKQAAHASNDFVGEAQGSLNLALIAGQEGDLRKAIAETEAASKLLEGTNGDALVAAQAAFNLGTLKEKVGDIDGALKHYQAIAQSGADFQLEASAWTAIGNIELSHGQAKEADEAFAKALEIYKAENIKGFSARLLTRRGSAQADMGKFVEAEKLHVQAMRAARGGPENSSANNSENSGEPQDNDSLYIASYELAFDFYLEGNVDKALADFGDLRKKLDGGLKVADTAAYGDVLNSIALCYSSLGQSGVARDYFNLAQAAYLKNNNKLAAARVQNSLAVSYMSAANLSEFNKRHDALVAVLAAWPQAERESADYKRLDADIAYNFAQSQVMDGHEAEATPSYQQALKNYREAGDLRGQMAALTGLGLAQLQAGKGNGDKVLVKNGLDNFSTAKKIAMQLGSLEGQWNAAIGEGSCYRIFGDNAAAAQNLLSAIQLFEKEKGHLNRDDAKTFALDLRFQAFEELVALQYEQKQFDQALATTERGKARAFLDLLEGRRRNLFADGKLAVLTGGEGGVGQPQDKAAANFVATLLPGEGDPNASVTRSVNIVPRNPNTADLETAMSPINADAPTIEQIKALVASHKTDAVEYFVTRDNLYIFVAHAGGSVDGTRVDIKRKDLEALISKAYKSVIEPPANFSDLKASNQRRDKNLADLYQFVVKPIKAFLPADGDSLVTIVPHRTLFIVPFAALIGEDKKFFIESHTLSVVPAIGVLRATEHMASEGGVSTAQDKLLAFGNPAIKNVPGLGPLPYAEEEVKKIAGLFAGRSLIKVGASASKSSLNSLAPGYNVIHLATHGLTDEEHPMDSAVLLATEGGDDGILSVRDILKMPPLKAHLVTLSACQTGRGKISGDGVAGLSRAFIIAGTPSVLVSLWNVDDVMTAFQMECFYKDYLTSQSKASALRAAQLKTIAFMEKGLTAPGDRANPRYWAAFQLIGEGR